MLENVLPTQVLCGRAPCRQVALASLLARRAWEGISALAFIASTVWVWPSVSRPCRECMRPFSAWKAYGIRQPQTEHEA